ncbi:hemicentin-1-like isoform X1 [Daphnia pulicaria]|uniref:hemicentin-1-like isoform X1 n=2 Tax=Daphnia pulicaria TaxID=35523 RepID=UPI001EEAD8A4|nr:hemicentin-1-like isoform X1 [Daphnia pulicaria]
MKSVSIPVLATFCGSFTGRSMDGRQDANQQQWVTSRCCAGRTQRPYGKRLSSVACFLLVVLMLILGSRRCSAAMESRDPASSGGRFGGGGGNHFLDDDEDDDGDGVVWPTLSLSPRFQHIPPPPPPVVYGPFFEPEFATNISVLAGQTVLLQCRVMDLGDRVVSWVRQSDLAILASGGVSHTSDNRITASADETLTDWELQIAEAQTKDSGLYECQVNTEPKINWPVTVHVEAALASIVGASELYVRTGSTISLTCIIQGSGSIPPRVLFWFHNSKPIALDSPRGGISLETERTVTGMSSKLLLTRATVQDGGNYTCAPPGAQPADVTVHVLNGEHPAAMQRGNRSPSTNGGERAAHLGAKCLWAVQVIALQYSIQRWLFGSPSPTV